MELYEVERLEDAAGSLRELAALLRRLEHEGVALVARDVGLDTRTPSGRRAVALLLEVERWEREPPPGRSPRGRPGLAARAPELRERIVALRERGLSLQAIADALNEQGLPTPRGGARWRPSSVQAALGYRRPPPPPPHLRPGGPPKRPKPPHRKRGPKG